MNRPGAPPSQLNPDAAVRSTDTDALVSRASASSLGYLSDPFASLFLPPALRRSTEKRPPLINIGTHARTWAVDALVEQFLLGGEGEDASSSGSKRQVLSLGAGTDTRYWRFRERFEKEGKEWRCRTWVEVDFEEATSGKARTVSGKAVLKDKLGGEYKTEKGGTALNSPLYTLLPGDLRTFSTDLGPFLTSSDPFPTSSDPILDPTIPTLLLAECVLIYLPPTSTNSILSWFSQTFPSGSATVSYDPFGLNDSFGKVMLRNLATRNLDLPAAATTLTLSALSSRLLETGFASAKSLSIKQIRESVIPTDEVDRVAQIERIDEVDELNLVLDHYAVTWGSVEQGPSIGLVQR